MKSSGKVHKKLKEKGVIFAVGSGRQYHNLKERFSSIKDDMLFIAENGTYVVYHEEELYINVIEKKDIEKILKISRNIDNCKVVLCGKTQLIQRNRGKFFNRDEKILFRIKAS